MVTAEDTKRLADIRATYYGGVYGNSPGAVDVPWLLDQLAARDARIAKMESALKTIRANMYDREVLGYCDAGCGQVAEDALE